MARNRTTDAPGGTEKEKKIAETETAKDDACRCREVSELSPRELLRLMVSDLAFWRKGNKR